MLLFNLIVALFVELLRALTIYAVPNGVDRCYAIVDCVRAYVRRVVCPPRNVTRERTAELRKVNLLSYVCTSRIVVRPSNFSQIVDVLNFHLQGLEFRCLVVIPKWLDQLPYICAYVCTLTKKASAAKFRLDR